LDAIVQTYDKNNKLIKEIKYYNGVKVPVQKGKLIKKVKY